MNQYPYGAQVATNSYKKIPLALTPLPAGIASDSDDGYEYFDPAEFITKGREGFVAYRVTGDSMVERIQPNDVVMVDPYSEPKNGEIVASNINGKINVKFYKKTERGLYLVSANKKYQPQQITDKDDVFIIGVVRGCVARF